MPASVFWVLFPATTGRMGDGTRRKFKNVKNNVILCDFSVSNHFTYILSRVLCPVPCLHFYHSFCLETEKSPWRPKRVLLGQKRF
ncbi:unnamed protein product [Staurois parvus]|uniref:Secreted protein n=1 Tax=Staurois parvus TaxID=386267 RepID=A0ABN9GUQ6_9NEOB|nr:unnamed protein product [Staurois parvus]